MQTALYGKIKERRERDRMSILIGLNTQNIPYLSTVATQYKTRQRRVRGLLMRVKARRHVRRVLMMGEARKVRINDG